MILHRIYNDELAQASYLVGSQETGEALIVDPNRDADQYVRAAEQEGLRITAVIETHIHADFVSGAPELSQRTGARLLLSDAGPREWKYAYARDVGATLLCDGDEFQVGEIRLRAMHTPGHTPEHLSLLVTDTEVAPEPMGAFTGDFLFVGDVGRPDLLETAAGIVGAKEVGARQLFAALSRFREQPDYLQIWPGHGTGSACGRSLGAVPQSTMGYEKRFNWGFQVTDEEEFVREVLSDQPDTPAYFARMKQVNRHGAAPISSLPSPSELPASTLRQELGRDTMVVDIRSAREYAVGHVPGTLNLPLGSGFLTWAGELLPYDRPLALLGASASVFEAIHQLRLIGHDAVTGYWTLEALRHWEADAGPLEGLRRIAPVDLRPLVERGEVEVLDVRRPGEHEAEHIQGSRNVPLAQLKRRLGEVPEDRPVAVHCQGGLRSAIAASILAAHGHKDVLDLEGGFSAWRADQRSL